jgi:deoxycytidylate deaminase
MNPSALVGLTGAFGSGCTTAAKFLRDGRGFSLLKLSDPIKQEWERTHVGVTPTRYDLQRLGDELRSSHHTGILVERVLADFEGANQDSTEPKLVIDGIRNSGEVAYLRDRFGYRFTLVGVLAPNDARWDRIEGSAYTDRGLGLADYLADDQRDKNEETPYGQQVELCLDRADILINNAGLTSDLRKKVLDFVDLATGTKLRGANKKEILMNIAYSAAHSSKCIKRHVGAVVVDTKGQVVGVGYNENPLGTKPCIEEKEYDFKCFRDIIRNQKFEQLMAAEARCPKCGEKLVVEAGPPWRCQSCVTNGLKKNLEDFFFPDRAMNWCTAIHAEVWALLAAGERTEGGTLYTTTFPCF